jgi:hypothetical protein
LFFNSPFFVHRLSHHWITMCFFFSPLVVDCSFLIAFSSLVLSAVGRSVSIGFVFFHLRINPLFWLIAWSSFFSFIDLQHQQQQHELPPLVDCFLLRSHRRYYRRSVCFHWFWLFSFAVQSTVLVDCFVLFFCSIIDSQHQQQQHKLSPLVDCFFL